MSDAPGLIVGNLDCESELAGRPMKPAVERTVSLFATLLRAFASENDELWTPALVPPERIARVSGLPCPRLVSGKLKALQRERVLAWGATARVDSLRAQGQRSETASTRSLNSMCITAARIVWDLPAAPAHAAARANHRAFTLDAAAALGHRLEGSRMIASIADLEGHLASGGALASSRGAWVLKAPYSAAGRDRVLSRGARMEGTTLRAIERLLELNGELLFEPWLDRTADFGVCAAVAPGFLHVFPPHGLEVDARGAFRGISLALSPLSDEEQALLDGTVRGVAAHLRAIEYSGPFSVDCWRHRDREGRIRFHPLGEVNARMTFGLVARALEERLVESSRIARSSRFALRFGKGSDLEASTPASDAVIPLVSPSGPQSEAVWVNHGG